MPASTYAPISAFDMAREYIKRMPLEDVQTRVLDAAHKRLWFAAPWRWTIGTFSPITVSAAANDFTIPGSPVDADVAFLVRAYLDDGVTRRELYPDAALPSGTTAKGSPNKIAYLGGTTPKVRINPVVAAFPAGATPTIQAWYKKTAPVIKKSNSNTPGILSLPDDWSWVYDMGVLYYAYLYGDDPRAGGVQMQMGKMGEAVPAYSGALANFMEGITVMRQSEPLLTRFEGLDAGVEKKVG